jgi:hypothetical protein
VLPPLIGHFVTCNVVSVPRREQWEAIEPQLPICKCWRRPSKGQDKEHGG